MAGTDLVPVVRFKNRRGVGEYEPHLDLLDRIDNEVFRRIGISAYQAFRQRAAIGLPNEDEDGQEIDYSPRSSRRTRARCGSCLRARRCGSRGRLT
jgi:hypothetical protein